MTKQEFVDRLTALCAEAGVELYGSTQYSESGYGGTLWSFASRDWSVDIDEKLAEEIDEKTADSVAAERRLSGTPRF